MIIKDVSVHVGCTLNMGNYQSAKADVGFTADVEPGDDPDDVMEELRAMLLIRLQTTVEQVAKRVESI